MSVTELMVALCIILVLAAVAIPGYVTYVQQARLVSLVLPRLHLVETRIALFYSTHGRLPTAADQTEVLAELDTEEIEIALATGSLTMTVRAAAGSRLQLLDGHVLAAAPVVSRERITGWHLDGELARRLGISY